MKICVSLLKTLGKPQHFVASRKKFAAQSILEVLKQLQLALFLMTLIFNPVGYCIQMHSN